MDVRATWVGTAVVTGVLLQALVAVRKSDRCLPPARERGLYLLKWWRVAAFTLLSLSQAVLLALRWRWATDEPELPCAVHADSAALAAWGITLVVLVNSWPKQASLIFLPTALASLLLGIWRFGMDWFHGLDPASVENDGMHILDIAYDFGVVVLLTAVVIVELIISTHVEAQLDTAAAAKAAVGGSHAGELEEEDVLAALAAKESKDKVKEKEGGKPAKATRLTMAASAFKYVLPDSGPLRARLFGCFVLVALERGVNLAVPILYKRMVDVLSQASAAKLASSALMGHWATVREALTGAEGDEAAAGRATLVALAQQLFIHLQRPAFWLLLYPWVLAYLAAYFLRGGSGMDGLLSSCRDILWAPITQAAYRRVSLDVFSHLIYLDHAFHVKRKTGQIMRILDRGTSSIQDIVQIMLLNLIPQLLDIGVACTYLATAMQPWAAGIVAVTVFSFIPLTIIITERRGAVRKRMNALDNAREARAADMLLNYETVKLFCAEGLETGQYDQATRQYQAQEYFQLAFLSVLAIVQGAIVWGGLVAGTCVCVWGVAQGTLTVGDTVLFITLMNQLYVPLAYFGSYYRQIQKALVDVENMFSLLATQPRVRDAPGAKPLQITNGTVEFQDVVFGYGKQPPPDNGSSGPGGAAGGAHEDQQHNGSGHESPEDAGTAKHSRESTPEKGEPDGNGNNGHHDSRSIIVSQSSAHPDHDIEPLPGPFQQKLGLSKRASSSLLTGLGRWMFVRKHQATMSAGGGGGDLESGGGSGLTQPLLRPSDSTAALSQLGDGGPSRGRGAWDEEDGAHSRGMSRAPSKGRLAGGEREHGGLFEALLRGRPSAGGLIAHPPSGAPGKLPAEPVLKGVSFTVPGGKTLAVVGATGSGKSTIIKLLLRFYDPWSGGIFIDGQDISKATISSVRQAIAVVPQDSVLFNQTIGYNIRYSNPKATMEEVEQAASVAHIHEAITTRFKRGYATRVGERGLRLSGGEKQRVAFARAVLKRPAILVLDEATSALDTITEAAINSSLAEMRASRQCTNIIIAHRLSTIQNADMILVLRAGKVAQFGTHAELLQDPTGLYSLMWSNQQSSGIAELAA